MNFDNLVVNMKDEEKFIPIHHAFSLYKFFVEAFNTVKAAGFLSTIQALTRKYGLLSVVTRVAEQPNLDFLS